MFTLLAVWVGIVAAAGESLSAAADIRHDMAVSLSVQTGSLELSDRVTLSELAPSTAALRAYLHAGLKLSMSSSGSLDVRVSPVREGHPRFSAEVPLQEIEIRPKGEESWPAEALLTFKASGKLSHPLRAGGEDYARGFQETPGLISPEGAYLSGASFFYPRFFMGPEFFRMEVRLPAGWKSVSQGRRTREEAQGGGVVSVWDSPEPMDEIYLIAAPFSEYRKSVGKIEAYAMLRNADPALAQKYLDATGGYLDLYGRLLGDYVYPKFALVENFWETGYGMPSFTLLGPKVLRLPFILHTSYPHEILHNWWGNGVFVDYERGNWCEGLTAYLADHLLKEEKGLGEQYRRDALEGYLNYVHSGSDFPLDRFKERHSSATQAVGYGKSLMVFHMLRRSMGDEAFLRALRAFYQGHRFRAAGFDDLRPYFEKASGKDLGGFFRQWVHRAGAPEIELSEARVERTRQGRRLRLEVAQLQEGDAFQLDVPVAISFEGEGGVGETRLLSVPMSEKRQTLLIDVSSPPAAVRLDPRYDLFRKLDRAETPPTIGQTLGAEKSVIVIAEKEPEPLQAAYRSLAEAWRAEKPGVVSVRTDAEAEGPLPKGRGVWLLGRSNRFRDAVLKGGGGLPVDFSEGGVSLEGRHFPWEGHGFVVSARRPEDAAFSATWVAAAQAQALPALARKLVHYGKYSYLAFEGERADNAAKGAWPAQSPRLSRRFSPAAAPVRLAPSEPLTRRMAFSSERMKGDVLRLASAEMEGRGLGSAGLDQAADYLAGRLQEAGLKPWSANSYFQEWSAELSSGPGRVALKNVIGILPGSDPGLAGEWVLVSAHYDHLGLGWPDARPGAQGRLHPGADDNASGVSALLALAETFGRGALPRGLIFAAFTGEEAGRLGSRRFVKENTGSPLRVVAAVNLDTVGRLGGRKPVALGTGSAREWARLIEEAGNAAGQAADAVAEDPGGSDQVSFAEAGIPAIQLFAGPHEDYHRPSDTPEKLDYQGLSRIAALTRELLQRLVSGPGLTSAGLGAAGQASRPAARRVSLGTIPDFVFSGEGARLSGVSAGSPAEKAGLRPGDVIVALGGMPVKSLREFSGLLKDRRPGELIAVGYIRDGRREEASATLEAR
ncbi:MAG TPA: hypothetical protein DCZ01_07325 [Elusimicrobia bacterium]|nr:MAG: hypothetical protein A2X37_06645 [Elusimicrobia bacterium GWA2_66_18]OGR69812.1 MAG: hypothetical protein A2X40_01875 [Elusimicrobia bacterium GWC2_65_9]HAZ08318.1 hypothetical protein [Elusimicrobiota bacterium]